MSIWVTGARGFIGRHVARLLARDGWPVVGLGHGAWPEAGYRAWGLVDWLNGEVSHPNLDALAGRHGQPEGVIHLAGGSSVGPSFAAPAEDFRRSVAGAADLAEWLRLRAPATPVVLASSAAVYGAGHATPIPEDTSCQPYSPYGFHKRMAELAFESYARNFGLKVAIVRMFSVYGPELRKQLLWDACSRLAGGQSRLTLGGSGEETRDWLHVEDAARLLVLALAQAAPDCVVLNGGTGRAVSVRDIATRLCECWGGGVEAVFSGVSRAGDPAYLVADTARLRALGFDTPRDWRAGLADYVDWFRSAGGSAGP